MTSLRRSPLPGDASPKSNPAKHALEVRSRWHASKSGPFSGIKHPRVAGRPSALLPTTRDRAGGPWPVGKARPAANVLAENGRAMRGRVAVDNRTQHRCRPLASASPRPVTTPPRSVPLPTLRPQSLPVQSAPCRASLDGSLAVWPGSGRRTGIGVPVPTPARACVQTPPPGLRLNRRTGVARCLPAAGLMRRTRTIVGACPIAAFDNPPDRAAEVRPA